MNQPTDAELVQETLRGSREAFLQLYDRYAPLVRASCTATTQNTADGQDLAQEVFIRAYTRLDQLRDGERFGGWLMGLVRNVGKEWRKKRRRDRHRYVGSLAEDAAVEDTVCGKSEEHERLHRAIARLAEKERIAVELFYLEEEPLEKARSLLRVSRSGFYRILERGRRRLAGFLSKPGESLSATANTEEGSVASEGE
jgi:RNA polymerase sigma-70 factor, ECF subfamily